MNTCGKRRREAEIVEVDSLITPPNPNTLIQESYFSDIIAGAALFSDWQD